MAKKRKIGIVATATAAVATTAMLVGATYAWFTDSVTSKDNIIQAGTLNVTLEHSDSPLGANDNGWADASSGAIFDYDKWEPGYTAVKYVKIENVGTLDFKFKLDIVPNGAAAGVDLADVIEVYMFAEAEEISRDSLTVEDAAYVGTLSELMKDPDGAAYGVLYADETKGNTYEIYGIALKMSEEAGNEYMGTSVGGGFAVQLFATQLASESDSLGDDYDTNAPKTFTVNGVAYDTAEEALAAAKAGDKVVLATADQPIVIDEEMDLTISNCNITAADGENAITVNANATVRVNGYNFLTGGKNADGIYVAEGVKLTLTGSGNLVVKGNGGSEMQEEYSAGKGGSGIDVVGSIEITDLNGLSAEGWGKHAFGIGGTTKSIVIKNSTINYAKGGMVKTEITDNNYGKNEPEAGAAIGSTTDGAVIDITNSTVKKAEGGSKAAGIGAMYHTGVTVNITDSNVTAIGGTSSAGIGGSRVTKHESNESQAINVTITNSTINATGGDFAAGIGSGYNTYCNDAHPMITVSIDAKSNVTAQGGLLGAGVGTGHNVVDFIGNIECDTTNIKAGSSEDPSWCCWGNPCTIAEDIGLGVYGINNFYTNQGNKKVEDGLYANGDITDKNNLPTEYYVFNANGLQALKDFMDANSNKGMVWGKTYKIMQNIDATDVVWNTKFMVPDSATFEGFTFDGNGYTISNLTINGQGLFTGTACGSQTTGAPATFKNLTFDNVTVTGDSHHNGVVWGEAYGSITLENVHVINSKVSGGCNVGGLVGRNSESHATIKFVDCSVKNTTIEATQVADYAGASAFLGMALHIGTTCSANVIFEGTNVSEGNTITTAAGMQGGGIYTTATWDEATWQNPNVVNDFTDYNSSNN